MFHNTSLMSPFVFHFQFKCDEITDKESIPHDETATDLINIHKDLVWDTHELLLLQKLVKPQPWEPDLKLTMERHLGGIKMNLFLFLLICQVTLLNQS